MNLLSSRHVAIVGCGSIGSAAADMLWRSTNQSIYGMRLTLIDPDVFEAPNLSRHILMHDSLGKPKALEMAKRYPNATGYQERFDVLPGPVDAIMSCVDSLACESQINAYSLENGIPAVYGGVHGDAHTAEIITVVPGKTPCYDCWEREGELPLPSQEDYSNPDYDKTKMPSMPGLWGDVLMAASLQFQAVLGILGARKKFPPLVLMSLRYPFRVESHEKKRGCAICSNDFSKLTI